MAGETSRLRHSAANSPQILFNVFNRFYSYQARRVTIFCSSIPVSRTANSASVPVTDPPTPACWRSARQLPTPTRPSPPKTKSPGHRNDVLTTAHTFDQEIYRSWCSGRTVWIEDDAGVNDENNYPSATSADFCNTATGQENDSMNADSLSKDKYTHMCVYKDLSFRNCECIECVEIALMSASHSPYNPGSVEGQDLKSDKKNPIAEK